MPTRSGPRCDQHIMRGAGRCQRDASVAVAAHGIEEQWCTYHWNRYYRDRDWGFPVEVRRFEKAASS